MIQTEQRKTDRLARAVQIALLTGLIPAAVVLAIGLAVALASGQPRPDGPPAKLLALLSGVIHGQGVPMLDLGIVLLMLTPLLRVIVLAIGWTIRRDLHFALTALTVATLLALSLILGTG